MSEQEIYQEIINANELIKTNQQQIIQNQQQIIAMIKQQKSNEKSQNYVYDGIESKKYKSSHGWVCCHR